MGERSSGEVLFVHCQVTGREAAKDHFVDGLSRQAITFRQPRIASWAPIEQSTFLCQFRPRGAMDCSAHPTAREQRFIRRIHNSVKIKCRDVGADGTKGRGYGRTLLSSLMKTVKVGFGPH